MQGDDAGLVDRAGRGALWALLGFGGGQALRFGGNLVLTRLLLPEAFGLMVLVNTFLMGLLLFSDIGVGTSVIQNKRGDERAFLDTAWTISVVRGCAVAVIAALAALPFSVFYEQPALLGLLPVAALSTAFMSSASMRMITANRQLRLRRMVAVELGSQALGLALTIALAFITQSVWALVLGSVLGAFVRMIASFVVFEGERERFRWDKSAAQEIVKLGKWVFVSTALMFLANNLDRFVFGKVATLDTLGLYNQATQLAAVPANALSHLTGNIVFPLFSAMLARGGDLNAVFAKARFPMLVAGGWAVSGLVVGGPAAVAILYPEIYAPAGTMLQLIAIASWFGLVLEGTNGAMLLAHGKANWVAAGSLAKVVSLGPCMVGGWFLGTRYLPMEHAEFFGALGGLVVSECAKYAVSSYAIGRFGMRGRSRDFALTGVIVVSTALGVLAVDAVTRAASPHLASLAQLSPRITPARIDGAVAGVCAAVVVTALWSPLLRAAIRSWRTRAQEVTEVP